MKNASERRYFIKKDGVVEEVSKEKYDLFKKKLKMLKKQYLCPNCKECICEKIRYSDINRCEEVNVATYKLSKGTQMNEKTGKLEKKTEVEEFIVFDCNKFNLYSDYTMENDGTIRRKTELEKEATKTAEMKEKENKLKQEKQLEKLQTNKEILESIRNKVKQENEMKLVYRPYPEGIEPQTATSWK